VSSVARIQGLIDENPEDKNAAIGAQVLLIVGELAQITGVSTDEALLDEHGVHLKTSIGGTFGFAVAAGMEAVLLSLEVSRLKHEKEIHPDLGPGVDMKVMRYMTKITTNITFSVGSLLGATGVALESPYLQLPGGIAVE